MKSRKPVWWPILLSIPIMLGLVILLHAAHLGTAWEDAGDGLTFILIMAALMALVRMNERAMMWSDVEKNRVANDLKVTVYLAPAERQKNRDLSRSARSW